METIIVICLLIIIVLLVQDKIVIWKRLGQKLKQEIINPNLPDIMGQSKPVKSLSKLTKVNERKEKDQEEESTTFNTEIESKEKDIQIPREELDDVFKEEPNWEEEEEEWGESRLSSENNGFAQGVTFEELSSVRVLLQKDKLEFFQKEAAVAIVQKIQGTELFSLLENSMEGTSHKIARLLDKSLSFETKSSSSSLRNDNLEDFDIRDFL